MKMFEPNTAVVKKPYNKFKLQAPTLKEGQYPTTTKHNHDQKFDYPTFAGTNKKGEVQLKSEV
jgi:hypothetical protein